MPKLLSGRPKGLEGRSEVWLIWEGRRMKGLTFSGDSELALVGVMVEESLVGD